MSLLMSGGWNQKVFEEPSNPNHSLDLPHHQTMKSWECCGKPWSEAAAQLWAPRGAFRV